MKTALTTDNIMVLYEFLKSENNDIEVFEIFKRKTISVYHNENYEYDFGISNIILEKPLVYSYKNQMLQCVVRRKTIFKNSNEVITTNMWYYSTDGKNLKYDNFSLEIDKKTLLKSYPFIDLKLFDKI
jgi:prolyl oligopeptidase PreP (S9A serine peptidase family)